MRVSVRRNDPGYSPMAHRFSVLFNGEPLARCVTADEEMGIVWVERFDEDKRAIVEDCIGGKVEIVPPTELMPRFPRKASQ